MPSVRNLFYRLSYSTTALSVSNTNSTREKLKYVPFITRSSATADIARVGGHYTSFKVIQGHQYWYQPKACMLLHISE